MKKRARHIIGGIPLTFGEGNIKGQIKNVLNFKKPATWVLIISALAVILSSVCLLTNPALKLELELPDATSLGNADVNRDGLKEAIYLDQSQRDNGSVTLRIYDSSGNEIWSEQASTSHAGWTSLFLCEQGGEDYLLRYLPGMWQGYCTYTYTLFTLVGGAEHVVRSNTIEFDVNGVNKLDAPNMIAFAEEVNALLGKSTLLMSSEGGEYSFSPSSADRFFERYSWLDEATELYADGDDLNTRLVKYSEYAVSNHR